MKLELPGQFKGPECRRLISSLRLLRSRLEPWFSSFETSAVSKLAIVLRVDGSLGSFGPSGIENIDISQSVLSCDLVVSDRGWGALDDDHIFAILTPLVLDAVSACMTSAGENVPRDELLALANGG